MQYSDFFFETLKQENSEEFIEQKNLYYNNIILPFYKERGIAFTFLGAENIPISCRYFKADNPRAKVVLSTGYNESYLKYAEFIYDLVQLGISVTCFDHRGQGFSGRFHNQNKRGYFDQFSHMVEDLSTVFNKAKDEENKDLPIYMVAHSMGGAVSAMAICEKKIDPKIAILSAPMFEIMLSPWSALESPILGLANIFSKMGKDEEYAFGQKDCIPFLPFETNDVTHSKFRFMTWRKHVSEINEMQLGGPTFGWISRAIQATRKIRKLGSQCPCPMLILQAEEDTVVRNSAHDVFLSQCPQGHKIIIGHAKHEILMEIDFIRNKVLDIIKGTFFK